MFPLIIGYHLGRHLGYIKMLNNARVASLRFLKDSVCTTRINKGKSLKSSSRSSQNSPKFRRTILHISSKSTNPWRSYDVISIFSRCRPAAILDLIWITLDHPRSAIVGLRLVLKFGFDRIHSFGDIVIFIFGRFGLQLPIHAHFWGFRGIFPQMTSLIILTPKRHFLTRKHVV